MSFTTKQPSYQHFRTAYAERRRDIGFFLGAGLSAPAGLPTWAELLVALQSEAVETLATLKEEDAIDKEDLLSSTYKPTISIWKSFSIIKNILGDPVFKSSIRKKFEVADALEPPDLYKEIWQLEGVSSLLTLNIDGFASKAHRRVRPMEVPAEFNGKEASHYVHLVKRRKPFIANLHGITANADSWVFTQEDLSSLISKPTYIDFIRFIFHDLTIVFLGISADDVAVGGFLEALTKEGIDLGEHFWITARRDAKTDRWASKAGLQIIRYEADPDLEGNLTDHTSAIKSILADLKGYVSLDRQAPAVVGDVKGREVLPDLKEMKSLDDDKLRLILAGYAKTVIERNNGKTTCEEYAGFLRDYSPVIHQSWHLTFWPPHNIFHGYTVTEEISVGPFSKVWRLVDSEGTSFALKMIQMDNLEKGAQLESFRRGVQSLQYLTSAEVPGTAKIVDAFEIPTSVIMEFVEGENLENTTKCGRFTFWNDGLPILISVCRHIEFSHNLPQGVLHRDIRPSNIMVPNFYYGDAALASFGRDKHDVVLLNYDMSWHTKAHGQTITGSIEEAGYYAPEQLENIDGEKARSTLVDSYGIGMTLYYVYTREMPPSGGSKSVDWGKRLDENFTKEPRLKWKSAPERVRRLVERSTEPDPLRRLSVRQISAELTQIRDAVSGDWEELSPDFWAEELFSHVIDRKYLTSPEGDAFKTELRTGRIIVFRGDLRTNAVIVEFRNIGTEGTDWKNVDKIWNDKLCVAKDMLKGGGWIIHDSTHYSHMEISLNATLPVSALRARLPEVAKNLEKALEKVRLD